MSSNANVLGTSWRERLVQRLRGLLGAWGERRAEPPQVTAEYLRLIYRNLSVSSPVSLVFVMYLTAQAEAEGGRLLSVWSTVFCVYLALRWVVGLIYPRQGEVDPAAVPFWSGLSIAIQACNGVLLSILARPLCQTARPLARS